MTRNVLPWMVGAWFVACSSTSRNSVSEGEGHGGAAGEGASPPAIGAGATGNGSPGGGGGAGGDAGGRGNTEGSNDSTADAGGSGGVGPGSDGVGGSAGGEPVAAATEGGTTSTDAGGGPSAGGANGTTSGTSADAGGTSGTGGGGTGGGGTGGGGTGGGGTGGGGTGGGGTGGGDGAGPVPGTEGFNCEPADGEVPALALEEVAVGLLEPVLVTFAPGDATRLFVVEQPGRIRIIENGSLDQEPFLDLTASVENGGIEQGLLGLAFHPDYAENGRFYVNYTAKNGVHGVSGGDTIVSEFSVGSDPNIADISSERVILTQAQPQPNNNGGMLAFGPSGFLFIGLGDGGGAGDPYGNAQDTSTWLGKMLRIDVDGSDAGEYGIPSGNMAGPALPEIFHYGLRNPWRYSFDGCNGDLYLGDSGHTTREELNFVPPETASVNFGWNICEGTHLRGSSAACDREEFMAPIADYGSDVGKAIIGGYVYRGSSIPALRGMYFYADYISGAVSVLRYVEGEVTYGPELVDELGAGGGVITSLGQDFNGELYLVHDTGEILRIEAE